MRRLNARQRLLLGALLLAGVILALDRFTGRAQPAAAQAQPGTTAPAAAPLGWQEVETRLARVQENYVSVAAELQRLERDLFVPSAAIDATYGTLQTAPEREETQSVVDPAAEFRARHRLLGVMLGSLPLATIDDRVLPLGAELEGYRLVRVTRDQVVFVEPQTQTQIVLEIELRPGMKPAKDP